MSTKRLKSKQHEHAQIVGFIVTPGEIAARISGLDAAISALGRDVKAEPINTPALGADWRAEFDAFVRRWGVTRDSFASWDARLFATRVMPILDDFESSYRFWARDFQRKAGRAPSVPLAAKQTGMADALIPSELWWILAFAAALYVLANSKLLR